jgi:hypothetical protein
MFLAPLGLTRFRLFFHFGFYPWIYDALRKLAAHQTGA